MPAMKNCRHTEYTDCYNKNFKGFEPDKFMPTKNIYSDSDHQTKIRQR